MWVPLVTNLAGENFTIKRKEALKKVFSWWSCWILQTLFSVFLYLSRSFLLGVYSTHMSGINLSWVYLSLLSKPSFLFPVSITKHIPLFPQSLLFCLLLKTYFSFLIVTIIHQNYVKHIKH